jgi:hypothetical protein
MAPQSVDARERDGYNPREHAVLALLVKPDEQRPWSISELVLEVGDALDVEDCVRQLQARGLAHRLGGFVWGFRAALAANDPVR